MEKQQADDVIRSRKRERERETARERWMDGMRLPCFFLGSSQQRFQRGQLIRSQSVVKWLVVVGLPVLIFLSKRTSKREQYQWMVEKNWTGCVWHPKRCFIQLLLLLFLVWRSIHLWVCSTGLFPSLWTFFWKHYTAVGWLVCGLRTCAFWDYLTYYT